MGLSNVYACSLFSCVPGKMQVTFMALATSFVIHFPVTNAHGHRVSLCCSKCPWISGLKCSWSLSLPLRGLHMLAMHLSLAFCFLLNMKRSLPSSSHARQTPEISGCYFSSFNCWDLFYCYQMAHRGDHIDLRRMHS